MTLRQIRYSRLFLGVINAGAAIWALAESKYAFGAVWLTLAAVWLVVVVFRLKEPTSLPKAGGDAPEADT